MLIKGTDTIADTYPFPICPADRLDVMITDWDASEDDLKLFDEKGIEIVIVEKEVGIR
nr:hypothetical protein [uncultured Acetatifactor sp.]